MDDLEQYQRRQCLRIFGVKEEQNEDTDKIAMEVSAKIGVQLDVVDIDRCHRVGKPQTDKPRAIIVKFVSYRKRSEIFRSKKQLKGTGITIREDLTRLRHKLLLDCVTKYGLQNTWTQDGAIIVKVGDSRRRITRSEDIQ